MITRVTHGTFVRSLQSHVARLQREIARAQETVSSQKILHQASDDPAGSARVTALRADAARLGAWRDGLGFGTAVLGATDAALDQAQALVTRAREIASQHASGLTTPEARVVAAEEVEELERELLALGNTAIAGRYVFGGLATGAAPFTPFDAPGFDPQAAYVGSDEPFAIATGPAESLRLTSAGDDVFGATLVALDDLRTALAAGSAPTGSIDALAAAAEGLLQERASVGGRTARADERDQAIVRQLEEVKTLLAGIEDADPAAAVSELVALQTALEATLAAGVRLLRSSILDVADL